MHVCVVSVYDMGVGVNVGVGVGVGVVVGVCLCVRVCVLSLTSYRSVFSKLCLSKFCTIGKQVRW